MKHTKKLLAALLSLALALALALPAMAEDEPDPAMPVITRQPVGGSQTGQNTTFTRYVQARIPNGDSIGYEWYRDGVLVEGATGASITVELYSPGTVDIYVVVYNLDNPEYHVTSQTIQLELKELSFWEKVRTTLNDLFVSGGNFFGKALSIPLQIIAYPFVALFELLILAAVVVLPLLALPFLWIGGLFK